MKWNMRWILACCLLVPSIGVSPVALAAPPSSQTDAQHLQQFRQLAAQMRTWFKSNNTHWCLGFNPQTMAGPQQSQEIIRLKNQEWPKIADNPNIPQHEKQVIYGSLVWNQMIGAHHVGNCGEMSAALFQRLYHESNEKNFRVNVLTTKDMKHTFVAVRLASGTSIVIDPWKGTAHRGTASDYAETFSRTGGWVQRPPPPPE